MIINVEAGGFNVAASIIDLNHYGKNGASRDEGRFHFLHQVDNLGSEEEKGKQLDEKLVSGKYLVQSLKVVLRKLKEDGYITTDVDVLDPNNTWNTEIISRILTNNSEIRNLFNEQDWDYVQEACQLLRGLSCQVVAAHFIDALSFIESNQLNATTEGSVFWKMPGYEEKLKQILESFGVSQIKIENQR